MHLSGLGPLLAPPLRPCFEVTLPVSQEVVVEEEVGVMVVEGVVVLVVKEEDVEGVVEGVVLEGVVVVAVEMMENLVKTHYVEILSPNQKLEPEAWNQVRSDPRLCFC